MSLAEEQISTLQLLVAMYPLPSELILSPETSGYLYDGNDISILSEFSLNLYLQAEDDQTTPFEISIFLPLDPKLVPPCATVSIRQPPWLPRAEHDALLQSIPPPSPDATSSEYLMPILESLPGNIMRILSSLQENPATQPPKPTLQPEKEGMEGRKAEERVWYWFPSLSSKEKRGDLIEYAEEMRITGFVLAGKPGLLCVEGPGAVIDNYMRKIRNESWADIPAFQKKVTERLRVPVASPADRLFAAMTDITNEIRHTGQYNHRGDMSEMKKFMDQAGVGEEFVRVIMNQPQG